MRGVGAFVFAVGVVVGMVGCGSPSASTAPPSQQAVWSIGSSINGVGNDTSGFLSERYGVGGRSYFNYDDVHALATNLEAKLADVNASVCAGDPDVATALDATQKIVAFIERLNDPATTQDRASSGPLETEELALEKTMKDAFGRSKCAALYSPNGLPAKGDGTLLKAITSFPNSGSSADAAAQTFQAIAIENAAGQNVSFDALEVQYVDGSTLSVPYAFPIDHTIYSVSGTLGAGSAITIDIKPGAVKSVALVNGRADATACETPGPKGGGSPCSASASIKIYGLAQGNGLAP